MGFGRKDALVDDAWPDGTYWAVNEAGDPVPWPVLPNAHDFLAKASQLLSSAEEADREAQALRRHVAKLLRVIAGEIEEGRGV